MALRGSIRFEVTPEKAIDNLVEAIYDLAEQPPDDGVLDGERESASARAQRKLLKALEG